MSDILLQVKPRESSGDPLVDATHFVPGDFVEVLPDDSFWSETVRLSPRWGVIRARSVSIEQAAVFLPPQVNADPSKPSSVLQPRAFGLDLAKFPAEFGAWLADDTLRCQILEVDWTIDDLMAMRVEKPMLHDPLRL